MEELEQLNGGPFRFYGCYWDIGGLVTSWEGGALAEVKECRMGVIVDPTVDLPDEEKIKYGGMKELSSSNPVLRAAGIRINRLVVNFAD